MNKNNCETRLSDYINITDYTKKGLSQSNITCVCVHNR